MKKIHLATLARSTASDRLLSSFERPQKASFVLTPQLIFHSRESLGGDIPPNELEEASSGRKRYSVRLKTLQLCVKELFEIF
jgi:hypothetical protein